MRSTPSEQGVSGLNICPELQKTKKRNGSPPRVKVKNRGQGMFLREEKIIDKHYNKKYGAEDRLQKNGTIKPLPQKGGHFRWDGRLTKEKKKPSSIRRKAATMAPTPREKKPVTWFAGSSDTSDRGSMRKRGSPSREGFRRLGKKEEGPPQCQSRTRAGGGCPPPRKTQESCLDKFIIKRGGAHATIVSTRNRC